MGKREVKKGLKNILKSINIEEIKNLEGVDEIISTLEKLENATENYGIGLNVDYDELKSEALITALEQKSEFEDLKADIENIISDVEEWMEGLRESRQEIVEEEFLEPLGEVLENLNDTSWIESKDDIDTLLSDNKSLLESIMEC